VNSRPCGGAQRAAGAGIGRRDRAARSALWQSDPADFGHPVVIPGATAPPSACRLRSGIPLKWPREDAPGSRRNGAIYRPAPRRSLHGCGSLPLRAHPHPHAGGRGAGARRAPGNGPPASGCAMRAMPPAPGNWNIARRTCATGVQAARRGDAGSRTSARLPGRSGDCSASWNTSECAVNHPQTRHTWLHHACSASSRRLRREEPASYLPLNRNRRVGERGNAREIPANAAAKHVRLIRLAASGTRSSRFRSGKAFACSASPAAFAASLCPCECARVSRRPLCRRRA